MENFEKLGSFYLGKSFDLKKQVLKDELVLVDSKDFTTHAVCVGMTGSGKTGLCCALLEEAAIDGIPSIIIDPKGDMTNLALAFPNLSQAEFLPWVNESEASQQNKTKEEYAAEQAAFWKKGIESWGQDSKRIQRLRDAADMAVYTPGSNAGLPVSILKTFQAPPTDVLNEKELFQERIGTTVSGLLGLVGISADPLQSREHILLSNIFLHFWSGGKDLDMETLIQSVQSPPFSKIGVLDTESFYPAKARFELSVTLNNLLASPTFQTWLEGVPLDVQRFLYSKEGKPRVSIFYIAHLSDTERMFFVSLLLNQVIGWLRGQSGTTSLRALLYFDELFGYMPPVADPPSKKPLLTMLKQARAFGMGVILATQNPVDLDYKGLSNTGIWLIGRLQTERDRDRILDGLSSASGQKEFNRSETAKLISGLGKRVFLLHNVHEDGDVIFQTRWALSYLVGPLTREQIKKLEQRSDGLEKKPSGKSVIRQTEGQMKKPPVTPEITQYFIPIRGSKPTESTLLYKPILAGSALVRFVDGKRKIDVERTVDFVTPIMDAPMPVDWEKGTPIQLGAYDLEKSGTGEATYEPIPPSVLDKKRMENWKSDFSEFLFRNQKIDLWHSTLTDEDSKPDESEQDFRMRLSQTARERRDQWTEDLRRKYSDRITALQERIRKAETRAEQESAQARQQKLQTAVSIGATLLGAFLGRKAVSQSTLSRAGSAVRSASRAAKESGDVSRAKENVDSLKQELEVLEAEFEKELKNASDQIDASREKLETIPIRPRKSDVDLKGIFFAWAPFWISKDGSERTAWE